MLIIPPYIHLHGSPEGFCEHCSASHKAQPLFEVPSVTEHKSPTHLCHGCWEFAHLHNEVAKSPCLTVQSLQERLGSTVEESLRKGGLNSQALLADPGLVPAMILDGLPRGTQQAVDHLKAGGLPTTGLCLAGPSDGGKTLAVASWLISWRTNLLRRDGPVDGIKSKWPFRKSPFVWIHMIDWNVGHHVNDPEGNGIFPLGEVPLLFIDDLGAEDAPTAATAKRGQEALARLIDVRDRENRPTFFTTNLTKQEIYERYGDRTARRMFRINTYVVFQDLPVMGRVNHT